MIHAQDVKEVSLFLPQSVATNGTATGTVSVVGYDYARVLLQLGTAAASNTDSSLSLTEGDSTTYATASDLAMTTAAPNTSTGQLYAWYLDLRKRKKNLKISYTGNTSAARLAACSITLSRAEQAPTSSTGRGLDGQVIA